MPEILIKALKHAKIERIPLASKEEVSTAIEYAKAAEVKLKEEMKNG